MVIELKQHPEVWSVLEKVADPEVPVLSILDLGIVRDVNFEDDQLEITITPTYTGCPAMNVIATQIRMELMAAGYPKISIKEVLSPAWTTAWMSEAGKQKLKAYGIAPPQEDSSDKTALFSTPKSIICPQCDSTDTEMVSQFGSTACKSLYKCKSCQEPFDYFKCH